MEAIQETVKLHGMWASPWVRRVTIALKMKGIPYEYFEEDLKNKSPLLLQYNPVKKLVPVLVHQGRPIAESLIILEYIDETWNNNSPNVFPNDPFQRSIFRFWAQFIDLQVIIMCLVLNCTITFHILSGAYLSGFEGSYLYNFILINTFSVLK